MEFNNLIPELSAADFKRSIAFYVDTIGFQIEYQREEDGFAFLSLNGVQLMIEQTNAYWKTGELVYPYGRGLNLQIKVDDVVALFHRLKKADYPIFVELEENWYRVNRLYYGFREFLVQDPDGYLLRFSQQLGAKENLD